MEIRNLCIEDYEELYSLWVSCAGMGLNNLDDSKEGIAKFLARNPETCFAAAEDGRLVGAILAGNGIHKAALVVFGRNEAGNAFWEKMGFTVRDDLVYRNKAIAEMVRIDT